MKEAQASAPGSLMIMGEYAVLHGYPALVAAIDRRITVRLVPRDDAEIRIHSVLGKWAVSLHDLHHIRDWPASFSYVLAALALQPIQQGLDVYIDSEFSSQQGLGSSAAVTVAVLAAGCALQQKKKEDLALYQSAMQVIHQVQGSGSGADVAASIFGGLLGYTMHPLGVEKIDHCLPLRVVFSGQKTPTPVALQRLEEKKRSDPAYYQAILEQLGVLAQEAIDLVRAERIDYRLLSQKMQAAQDVLVKLGVSTVSIESIIDVLAAQGIRSAKISGSGLGDCVIALEPADYKTETLQKKLGTFPVLPIQMGMQGVLY